MTRSRLNLSGVSQQLMVRETYKSSMKRLGKEVKVRFMVLRVGLCGFWFVINVSLCELFLRSIVCGI